jgi:hypothetical protein
MCLENEIGYELQQQKSKLPEIIKATTARNSKAQNVRN